MEKIERQIRRQEEIRQFTEEKMKFSSKVNGLTTNVDKEFANQMPQNLKDYTSEEIESKVCNILIIIYINISYNL